MKKALDVMQGHPGQVNRTILGFDNILGDIWKEEKMASNESIVVLKREALAFLASERERIMRLSREEAINEVLQWANLENKIQVVESVTDNIILEVT